MEIDVDDGVIPLITFMGLTGCIGCHYGCYAYLKNTNLVYKTKIINGEYHFKVPQGEYLLVIPKMCYERRLTLR